MLTWSPFATGRPNETDRPTNDNRTGHGCGYTILIEPTADDGYGAWTPDLPGCVALGDTTAEAITEMRSAIAFHLEGLQEDELPIPEPSITSTVVSFAA